MTLAAGFQSNLLTGLAVYIAAAGIEATWAPSGIYTTLQTGIVIGNIPQTPDRIITLSSYPVSDHPSLSDSVLGVQIRTRAEGADKRKVDNLDDAIFNLFHGVMHLILTTGVHIVQFPRVSGATLGQDANNRWSNVQNFHAYCWRPSTHRT